MDWIERYLEAVTAKLQPKRRGEVERELRASILDALDARGASPASEEDVTAVLAELGEPSQVAAGYEPGSQYLIGPELYPLFRRVIRVTLYTLVGASALYFAVALALGGQAEFRAGDLLKDTLETALGAAILAVVVIGVVFAWLQRSEVDVSARRRPGEPWDPRSLPALSGPDRASRFDSVVGLVASAIALVILGGIGQGAAEALPEAAAGVRPILRHAVLQGVMVLQVAAALSALAHAVALIQGRWRPYTRAMRLLADALAVFVFVRVPVELVVHRAALFESGLPRNSVLWLVLSSIAIGAIGSAVIVGLSVRAWRGRTKERSAPGTVLTPALVALACLIAAVPPAAQAQNATETGEAGSLVVPMVRSRPDSPTIELRFVRFPAVGDRAGSPIVYLAGGPGGSGIDAARGDRAEFLQSLRAFGDVIAFDQRGTGRSEPALRACQRFVELPLDEPGDPGAYLGPLRARVADCVDSLRAAGTDVMGFTTVESADDLDALRRVLGAERLTLVGVSYGTHLALAMARRHPERVDRMVLAGVEGPDHTLKSPADVQANLERVAVEIQRDPSYATRLPDPLAVIDSLLERLARDPVRVRVRPNTEVTVGAWDLQKFLADGMGSETALRRLPARLLAMSQGDFSDLGRWAHAWRRPFPVQAMSEAMDCASYASPARLEQVRREAGETLLGATIDYPLPGICEIDGLPRLDETFREPLERSIPTLFISGTLDGRTPASNAEEIAAGFQNARHLILGNVSHGADLLIASPEIQDVVHAFLADEEPPTLRIELPAWTFEP